jgi:hypothetical protein
MLRWELTATNVLNHPNWSNPGTDLSDPQRFGVITGTGGVNNADVGDVTDARQLRMALRLQW